MCYRLLPPVCRYHGKRQTLAGVQGNTYADECVRAEMTIDALQPGRDRLVCRWTNLSGEELAVQPEIRVQSSFAFTHYVIPGVSYNGNDWGRGKEPKGLAHDGQPWIFDYRRTTLPACTISENADAYLALMASDCDAASLTASCAMEPQADGAMVHRILYPEIEGPVTYCTRDGYTDPHEDFITMAPGETFTTTAYILHGTPYAPNFAAANVTDAALDLLGKPFPPAYSPDEAADLACQFARRLVMETNGRKMFCIGQLPTEEGVFANRPGHAIGWCGQNGMLARLMLQRGMETGDKELVEIGESCLDAFTHEAITAHGLVHANYHWMLNGFSDVEDTCNFGFAIAEIAQAWRYMRQHGVDKPDWLRAAKGIADFLIAHWSDAYGFGKAWNVETGECADA